MDFATGFAQGMQIGDMFRKRQFEQSIDSAGKSVQEEMQREKDLKAQKERAQQDLINNANPTKDQVVPSVYQQGDSLGLQGYQTGNKPVQTTVPTAPPGYMSKGDNTSESDYPSANPATEQTLIGNYGTTAAFKGEKPTTEDTLKMQQDKPLAFGETPPSNVTDLAQIKPGVAPQEAAKPKVLDTLNNQITAADNAKESYNYNMRVIRKLQDSGNARAALEYQGKVASSELTLAQADHTKFTTLASALKLGADTANNAIESMQVPGADPIKIYTDWGNSLREKFGYNGKLPFSLDPRENMKTLQQFQLGYATTLEKADLGIRTAAAKQKTVFDNAEFNIKQEKLTLEKIQTGLAISKENREQITSSFNRTVELTKLQNKYVNDINSTISEKDKEALKPIYEGNLKLLQTTAKALNIPMPNIAADTLGVAPTTVRTQPGVAPTSTAVNTPANAQPVNTRFSDDSLAAVGAKPLTDTAGGYPRPESVVKTPAQKKKDTATKSVELEKAKARLKEIDKLKQAKKPASLKQSEFLKEASTPRLELMSPAELNRRAIAKENKENRALNEEEAKLKKLIEESK